MRYLLSIVSFLFFITSYAQNIKVIDAISGVGEFKWGMTKEQINSTQDSFGWYNFYPGNFNIGKFPVSKIKIAINSNDYGSFINGVYWIEMQLTSNSKTDFDEIVQELNNKYGKATNFSTKKDNFSWEGNYVTVSIWYLLEDDIRKIVICYFKKSNKIEVGY